MTPQQIVEMAASEGVVLSVRRGRISFRGGSEALGRAALANEKALVEYLGGQFVSPWLEMANDDRRKR